MYSLILKHLQLGTLVHTQCLVASIGPVFFHESPRKFREKKLSDTLQGLQKYRVMLLYRRRRAPPPRRCDAGVNLSNVYT